MKWKSITKSWRKQIDCEITSMCKEMKTYCEAWLPIWNMKIQGLPSVLHKVKQGVTKTISVCKLDNSLYKYRQVNSLELTSHLYIYFFCLRPIFFLCQTLSSIQIDFLSFTRHIWISIQMNIQRVQWPSPTKAQTCHLQNFITLFGDLLSCRNHWNTFGSFLCTNQVVRYPKNQR